MPGFRGAQARQQRRAEERAAAKALRAAVDPIAVASENEQLKQAQRGAHALVHVLVRRAVGWNSQITIPRDQWMAIPPVEHLRLKYDEEGNVTLSVEKDA